MALTLKHQTMAQFAARAKARYDRAAGEEAAKIAKKLDAWVTAKDVPEADLQAAWALAGTDWKAVKDEWKALATAYDKIKEKKAK